MLNKKKLAVGSKIVVVKPSWGLPASLSFGTASNDKESVEVSTFSGIREMKTGDTMEIVKLPRKLSGIGVNSARVKLSDGVEGEVYWCELRASCNNA